MLKYPKKESGGQMNYLSDIEIAQNHEMLPITEIAKRAGIDEKFLEPYGRFKAKVLPEYLENNGRKNGKHRDYTDSGG